MDTTCTRIALGNILVLLLRVPSPQLVSLAPNSLTHSLSPRAQSSFASSSTQLHTKTSIAPNPISRSKQGPYTLLRDFNASLNADVDDDPGHPDILFREYCINLEDGERLNVTFIPSITAHPDSYAFISGIEIVSMPPYLYYTNPDAGSTGVPKLAGVAGATYPTKNGYALETKYRLRVGGADIPSSRDTGMLRTWDADDKYVTSPSVLSVDYGRRTKLSFTETPNYTAPDEVYRTLRNMGRDDSMNMRFNLTWQLPVDSGFPYLLRLHFCQLNPQVHKPGDLIFYIFIQDQLVEDRADILSWSDEQKGVPVVIYDLLPHDPLDLLTLPSKVRPHATPKELVE
ncbi:Receptor protein kinase FERONIA [Spatholobus suberectus]|nr:Receptor protein kinase FERONIA [Spatholobus suberectus]